MDDKDKGKDKGNDKSVDIPQSNIFGGEKTMLDETTKRDLLNAIKIDCNNYKDIPAECMDRDFMICALDNGLPFHGLNTGCKLENMIDFEVCLAAVRNCAYTANEIPDAYVRPVLLEVLKITGYSKPTTQKIPELNHNK